MAPHNADNFRGYTINELKEQRLVAQLRCEFLKEKLFSDVRELCTLNNMKSASGKKSNWFTYASKGLKLLSYADVFALGFSLFRSGRKVVGLFRRK